MGFFTAANPIMKHGGFTDYSKYKVLAAIDKNYLPKTEFLTHASVSAVKELMQSSGISYPIILKPDIGERGFGVEKIDTDQGLEKYFKHHSKIEDLILQEYVGYTIELGVMYSRKASEASGQISSVVMKQFLTITGDGIHKLEYLFKNDSRAKFYADSLLELYTTELNLVLKNQETKELVAIGNHCRGTMFLDANHLINDQLLDVFDAIAIPIKGYHFGRFDLRVNSLEDLYQGKNIKIMELNGAASEPAHIYDPNMSLLKAYRHLFAHWQRLFEISVENHHKGVPYTSAFEVWRAVRQRGEFKNN